MGYSCTAAASKTEGLWEKACREQTGSSNVFRQRLRGGPTRTFFYERGKEQDDGAITGPVFEFVTRAGRPIAGDVNTAGGLAKRSGSYRIEPDGTVTRAPAFLKTASAARDKYLRDTPGARENALATGA